MNTKRIIPLLLTFIALQGIANEPATLTTVVSESQENVILNDTVQPAPAKIHGSLFAAMPSFFCYNFNQESIFYTPALMGGFDLMYKRFLLEVSTFVGKQDSYGVAADLIYSIRSKSLDKEWNSTTGVIGEVTLFPAQQGNPEMWAYTAGLCHMIYKPYTWGMTGIGFLLGGSYMNEDFSLNVRMLLTLSIPVF